MFKCQLFHEIEPQKEVFISHGLADKNWREAQFVKNYDYIFVSGQLWKDKMTSQGISSDKILINGFSKLDPLFKMERKNNNENIVVLFAHTHNLNDLILINKTFLN